MKPHKVLEELFRACNAYKSVDDKISYHTLKGHNEKIEELKLEKLAIIKRRTKARHDVDRMLTIPEGITNALPTQLCQN